MLALIIDHVDMLAQYLPQHDCLEKLEGFLRAVDTGKIKAGRYELDKNGVYANVDQYHTKNEEDGRLEYHQAHVDLQYVASGNERIGVAPIEHTAPDGAFDVDADIGFRKGKIEQWAQLSRGMFALLLPHETHMPGITSGEKRNVIKVVFKLPVSVWNKYAVLRDISERDAL